MGSFSLIFLTDRQAPGRCHFIQNVQEKASVLDIIMKIGETSIANGLNGTVKYKNKESNLFLSLDEDNIERNACKGSILLNESVENLSKENLL
jgi:hypothetical protein